ncbi:MAG: M56 family metallopeptidase [Acidobacteriota bacterium]
MNEALEHVLVVRASAAWWSSIAPLAAQALVLVPLLALVDRLLPRRTWPQLRATMWLFVMIRLVLPPVWLTLPISAAWLPGLLPTWLPTKPLQTFDPAASVLAAERQPVLFWSALTVAVWLFGIVLIAVAGSLWHHRALASWRRASDSAGPPGFDALAAACGARLGIRRLPEIRFGATIASPFVAGVWRPTIFLPEDLPRALTAEQLEHVLLHELAHVRRRDTWIAAACTAIATAYWFHPCVWWAHWRLRTLREQCCDQTVARALDGVDAYRRTLLRFAAQRFGIAPGGLAFLRPESHLILRLRLLETSFGRPWLRRAVTLLMLAALVPASLPAAQAADRTARAVGEVIDRPPGCLPLRYMVLRRLAEEQAAAADSNDSTAHD